MNFASNACRMCTLLALVALTSACGEETNDGRRILKDPDAAGTDMATPDMATPDMPTTQDMNRVDMRDPDMPDMSQPDMPDMFMGDMGDMSMNMNQEEGVDCATDPDKDDDQKTRCTRCASIPAVDAPECDPAASFSITTEVSGGGTFSGSSLRLGPGASVGTTVATDAYLLRNLGMGMEPLRFRTRTGTEMLQTLVLTPQGQAEALGVKARSCPAQGAATLRDATGYAVLARCGSGSVQVMAKSVGHDLYDWNQGVWEKVMGPVTLDGSPKVLAIRPSK